MLSALCTCRWGALLLCCFGVFGIYLMLTRGSGPPANPDPQHCDPISSSEAVIVGKNGTIYSYDRSSPIIFVGGFPRSGTTLMRSMLDAHSAVRCGEETWVIPVILELVNQWNPSSDDYVPPDEIGLSYDAFADAMAAFILEVIVKHGEPAARLCNKDPFTLGHGRFLVELFPRAKFIFMIRDGRAVVHSFITRNVTIGDFDLTDYRQCLNRWSNFVKQMMKECDKLGEHRCLKVKYENLVLHPKAQMVRILKYLDIAWEDSVMHHEQYVNKPGGVSLSSVEPSTDQVVNPVNIDALSKWVGFFPEDVVQDMQLLAPMLEKLGYDPRANPPFYGTPDAQLEVPGNLKTS